MADFKAPSSWWRSQVSSGAVEYSYPVVRVLPPDDEYSFPREVHDQSAPLYGEQHGDGWVPIPAPSGYGWKWQGATSDDYNRLFKQSLDDPTPRQMVLAHGENPIEWTLSHPGVLALVPGWYDFSDWISRDGGHGQRERWPIYWRDGASVISTPPGWFNGGKQTGFLVIGAIAAIATAGAGFAAAGGFGGSGGVTGLVSSAGVGGPAGGAGLLEQFATNLPKAIIGSHGDVLGALKGDALGLLKTGGSVGKAVNVSDSNDSGDDGFSWSDLLGDINQTATTVGNVEKTLGGIFGNNPSQGVPGSHPGLTIPSTANSNPKTVDGASSSTMTTVLVIGGILLAFVLIKRK